MLVGSSAGLGNVENIIFVFVYLCICVLYICAFLYFCICVFVYTFSSVQFSSVNNVQRTVHAGG